MTLLVEMIENPYNSTIYQRLLGVFKKHENAKSKLLEKYFELKDKGFSLYFKNAIDFWYEPIIGGLRFHYIIRNVTLYGDIIMDNTVYNMIVDCGRNMSFNYPYRYHSLGWYTSIEYAKNSTAFKIIDNLIYNSTSNEEYYKIINNKSGIIIVDTLSISSPILYINDIRLSD